MMAIAMLLPALVDLQCENENWIVFVRSSITIFVISTLIIAATHNVKKQFSVLLGFLLTNVLWFTVCILGSLPLYFSNLSINFAQSIFESVSGVTSTGSTVLVGLDTMPKSILLWRSLLCWIGGIGFIALALLLLPSLRVGGIKLFHMESSDTSEKVFPRINQISIAIIIAYLTLTLTCSLCYFSAGMSLFDAINHAMTTIATAGFSTHDTSFAFFSKKPLIFIIATIFMTLSALPFSIYIKAALSRKSQSFFDDPQAKLFIFFVVLFSVLLGIWLHLTMGISFQKALFNASFHFVSVITTTGYASEDYSLWGSFACGIFFLASFVGGCSGSTSGGIKINRLIIFWKIISKTLEKLLSPNTVVKIRYGKTDFSNSLSQNVLLFLSLYMISIIFGTSLLIMVGIDFVSSFTGSLTALSNLGPGFGTVIGPSGNFSTVNDMALWILSILMLIGRLEIFTIIIVFTPFFWKR